MDMKFELFHAEYTQELWRMHGSFRLDKSDNLNSQQHLFSSSSVFRDIKTKH